MVLASAGSIGAPNDLIILATSASQCAASRNGEFMLRRLSGTRHKITMLAEKLMQDDVGNVVAAVVDAAVKGDMAAAKIILDRSWLLRRTS